MEHDATGSGETNPSRRIERLESEVAALKRATRGSDAADDDLRDRFEAVAGELQTLLAETNGGHGAINTHTGRTITPLSADPDDVSLDDVAHALANQTRFAGQCDEPYSVARHAVHVSREVEARGGRPAAIRWGLLHDATEAYIADVPAPVKRSLPGYTAAEARLAETVREAFDLSLSSEDERLVDAADSAVGRYELAERFPDGDHERPSLEFDPVEFERDTAGIDDEELFLRRARSVGVR